MAHTKKLLDTSSGMLVHLSLKPPITNIMRPVMGQIMPRNFKKLFVCR